MFFEKNNYVRAVCDDGTKYTGTIYNIAIQNCADDDNRPHALLFISQDKRFIREEGEFGCVSLWIDKIKTLELLEVSEYE